MPQSVCAWRAHIGSLDKKGEVFQLWTLVQCLCPVPLGCQGDPPLWHPDAFPAQQFPGCYGLHSPRTRPLPLCSAFPAADLLYHLAKAGPWSLLAGRALNGAWGLFNRSPTRETSSSRSGSCHRVFLAQAK